MEQKILAALLVTLLAASGVYYTRLSNESETLSVSNEFDAWKQIHGKNYSGAEHLYRLKVFTENMAYVIAHNQKYQSGEETYELGMTIFADLTNEEFRARLINKERKPKTGVNRIAFAEGIAAPDAVDHRDSGIVSAVKDQGSCGGCWAFGAIGGIEGILRKNGVSGVVLSEQELVDCVHAAGYDSDGCGGGFAHDGIYYAAKYGVAIQSEYAYEAKDGACRRSQTKTRYNVKGYIAVKTRDPAAFVEALAVRPLSAAINAGGIQFQLYKKGIFTKACASGFNDLNHEILVTGYASDYYNIKNSWGPGWGEEGYIRFGRISNLDGQCGVQQDAGYPDY